MRKGRKFLFIGILLLGLWGLAEAFSWIAFWGLEKQRFSYRDIRERQGALVTRLEPEPEKKPEREPTPREALLAAWGGPSPVLHPFLGNVHRPGAFNPLVAVFLNPDGTRTGKYPVNEFGFVAGDDFIQKRAKGRVIIGVSGGSVALAFAHLGAETLKEELKKDPRFAGKEIVVVPLAMEGWKQPQQLQVTAYYLALGGELDALINLDGFNEISTHVLWNSERNTFPMYPTNWGHLVANINDPEYMRRLARAVHVKDARADWSRKISGGIWRYSVAANLFWVIRDRGFASQEAEAEKSVNLYKAAESEYLVTGPLRVFEGRPAMYQALGDIWTNCSLILDRVCRGNGIRYFHFLQPNQYVEGSKPFSEEERRRNLARVEPFGVCVKIGYPILKKKAESLKEAGVAYEDLTGVFSSITEPTYSDACCHLNEKGNAVTARSIAASMLEKWNQFEFLAP